MPNLKFGIVAPAGEEPKKLLEFIRRAEESGFDSFWAGDHMVFMRPVAYDVLSTIAAASVLTDKISMGSFSDAHKFHPAVLAQRLVTLDHLTNGRFILGLGLGEAMNLDPYGIRWNKPLSRMVESVKLIRKLWESEEPFDYEGEFFTFKKAVLGAKPTRGKVPIYIAAHRPKSLRVAAEMGDGWITLPQPPSLFAKRCKQVEEWRKGVGGDLDGFEKCQYLFTSIAKDKDDAYRALENLRHTLIWSELYEEAYVVKLPQEYEGFGYMNVITTDEREKQRIIEQGKLFPKEAVFDFTLSGSAKDCIKRIEEYIDAGANHLLIHNFSADREWSYKVLTNQVIPYFR
ncbi:MAG TPA: LLM class flavin-dependent oxidoreductase [Thermodesulfobacteriota bacterium]|nr:LLM class flavin-dependent oxidoreductase [Thermodesulfobacteriota bacterium]